MVNYELEIVKLLEGNSELQQNYPRVVRVANAVARNQDDVVPYIWAYLSGKRDWKKVEKDLF